MAYDIKLVLDAKAELAETPIWNTDKKVLYWTDVFTGDFHIFDAKSGKYEVFNEGGMIGAAIPCKDGRVLLLLENGLNLFDPASKELKHLIDPEPGRSDFRLNDGRCDKMGRLWFSTLSKVYGSDKYDESMTGSLYMVDTDLSIKTVMSGINQLNGIGWSSDDTRMYVVDTHNFKLLSFDYDVKSGQTSEPKTACEIDRDFGFPDGMCVDAQDNVWIAHWVSGKISKWNPQTGELIETVQMPVPHITCCGFGGDYFDELYVTTARLWVDEADLTGKYSKAGAIFMFKPGVAGRESYLYNG
jgi:sugar lactone lactonase YvrE